MRTMMLLVCAVCLIACGGAMPRVEHSRINIQGHVCEMTKSTVNTDKLKDLDFTYKCDPPLPPGMILTAQGSVIPNPIANRQFATMANAPFNPPDQVCQMQETLVNGQIGARVPVCSNAATTREMVIQPLSH